MGYAVYPDPQFPGFRWAGYAVPAECDMPDCHTKIDRGMGYRCEEFYREVEDFDDEGDVIDTHEERFDGCELHFCLDHLEHNVHGDNVMPKPDTLEWKRWMLRHESWADWRRDNPKEVEAIIRFLNLDSPPYEEFVMLAKVETQDLDEFPCLGEHVIAHPSHFAPMSKWLQNGWVTLETHLPLLRSGDDVEHYKELIRVARSQWRELTDA